MLSAEPVCSCALFFVHIAHETAGAARTRSSPRPLTFEGGTYQQNSRAMRGEIVKLRLQRFEELRRKLYAPRPLHVVPSFAGTTKD